MGEVQCSGPVFPIHARPQERKQQTYSLTVEQGTGLTQAAEKALVRRARLQGCGKSRIGQKKPQGLKPSSAPEECGTAEAVPFVESVFLTLFNRRDGKPKLTA
jgi:hypothetical protein